MKKYLFLFLPFLLLSNKPIIEDQLYVPDDLEISLWAETPMLYNPTNMDVDYKGRIWVTEGVNYRSFNTKPGERQNFEEKGDRVVILEDTDQDGKADKSTVFVQDKDLTAPLGIAVIGNKVIVSCAPHVLIYTDKDGDDKADEKEIFLTGFGGFDHDHSLHSFIAGPDGNWYFNTGNAGPHRVTDKAGWTLRSGSIYSGGTPYNNSNKPNLKSDDGKVWVGGLALRVNPDGTGLKVMAHNFRNSYEVAVDSYGNMWQNDNDDQVIACRTSFLMEGGNAGYFSQDGTRTWQADRRPGQEMFTAHWHQEDPGVMPFGDKTGAGSPTGVMVYEGDELGEKYRGMLLSCEAGRNVVFGYKNTVNGAGFDMKRSDLISTFPQVDENYIWNDLEEDTRKWFRPSDVAAGTDGAIYVADWYDPVVGGHAMNDKKAYGRIYRITRKGKKQSNPKIDLSTKEGLLLAFKSPAVNVRNLGFNGLKALGQSATKEVEQLLKDKNPYIRARAVWLAAEISKKPANDLKKMIKSSEAVAAFRAFRDKVDIDILMDAAIESSDPAVWREASIFLADKDFEQQKKYIKPLLQQYDGKDAYYLSALGTGFKESGAQVFAFLQKENLVDKYSEFIFQIHPENAVSFFLNRAQNENIDKATRTKAVTGLAFIKTQEAADAMISLTKSEINEVAEQAKYWVSFRSGNDWAAFISSETILARMSKEDLDILRFRDVLLNEKASAQEKQTAINAMASSPFGGKTLLTLASQGKLDKALREATSQVIFNNPDLSIRTMAGDYFQHPDGGRISLDLAANMKGNKELGIKIFENNCASCHKYASTGAEIGPDLSLIKEKFDKNGLLDAIINPSGSMAFGYEPWIIATNDDNSYYGFLLSDGNSLVLQDITGNKITLKKSDIKSKTQLKNSLMPSPVGMGLKEKDLADLVSFLLER